MIPDSHPADCGACDPEAPCADCALAYGLLDAAEGEEPEEEEDFRRDILLYVGHCGGSSCVGDLYDPDNGDPPERGEALQSLIADGTLIDRGDGSVLLSDDA